jgi:hypothetical protein
LAATPILAGHQGALHALDRVPSAAGDYSTGAAGRTPADHQPTSPERRCHTARLRTMLAVAALLLVATATTALAGLTATAVD